MPARWSPLQRLAIPTLVASLAAIAVTIALRLLYPTSIPTPHPELSGFDDQKIITCAASTVALIKPDKMDFNLYERVWRLCGHQIYNNLLFTDFTIRRDKFTHQELDERVNLWLVVCITISGVLLAGLQLFMSYRLAAVGRTEFAKETSLLAEQGKISLQSSVTGVVVLIISLAFFIVYVKWIYSIQEFQIELPANLASPQTRLLPIAGGLNPPAGSPPPASLMPNALPGPAPPQWAVP